MLPKALTMHAVIILISLLSLNFWLEAAQQLRMVKWARKNEIINTEINVRTSVSATTKKKNGKEIFERKTGVYQRKKYSGRMCSLTLS